MKLYIPELGDKLLLSADWTFNLEKEYRNESLGAFFGYYIFHEGWVDSKIVEPLTNFDYSLIKYPERNYRMPSVDWRSKEKEAEKNCPEYLQYLKDYDIWYGKCALAENKDLIVTIPVGTILKVDRIYIRKGAKDYSSITFFANMPAVESLRTKNYKKTKKEKKKAVRFWAKLSVCNEIEFSKID